MPKHSPLGPGPLDQLTGKQRRFVEAYTGVAYGNATEAARLAGYTGNDPTLCTSGWNLLRKPEIKAAVKAVYEERLPESEEIIDRLKFQATADTSRIAECYKDDPDTGRRVLDWAKLRESGLGPLVKRVTPTKQGDVVEFHDGQRALELLGKYRALFTEKIKVESDLDLSKLSPEQLAALAAGKRPDDV